VGGGEAIKAAGGETMLREGENVYLLATGMRLQKLSEEWHECGGRRKREARNEKRGTK
jgi:hypothetical protein